MTRDRATPTGSSRREPPAVACFGEVLWDCLPRGLFLGGAPMNAAYHLAKQGLRARPITAVGRDFLGDEALRRMQGWDVDLGGVARVNRPTGTVRAVLDAAGVASYEIATHVAWDRIPVSHATRRHESAPAAIVHGTLALRETPNRRALRALFAAWPDALRVVDLNFRAPYDTEAVTKFVLQTAQLVKLNEDELVQLVGGRTSQPEQIERAARKLAARHGIERICVTAGARGAGLLWEGEWYWEKARPVPVRDTVGAGDAFLGGLLGAVLQGIAPRAALTRACRIGEFVATRDGATPDYEPADIAG